MQRRKTMIKTIKEIEELQRAEILLDVLKTPFVKIENKVTAVAVIMALLDEWIDAHDADPDEMMKMLRFATKSRPIVQLLSEQGPPPEELLSMTDEEYAELVRRITHAEED